MLLVDATMLNVWLRCREMFRLRYLEQGNGITPLKPALPLVTGGAFHQGVEVFWRGGSYEDAMAKGMAALDIDETLLSMPERERLQEAREYLPDMLACYFEEQEYDIEKLWHYYPSIDPDVAVEMEWQLPWICQADPLGERLALCGKMDRVEHGPHIFDCKTASEIGKNWKHDYREMLLRDIQFQLYDFYLTSIGHTHTMTTVEVITKPYRGKPPKFYPIDLPELAAYRERFRQQLDWNLKEMVHYVNQYQAAKPWPMAAATVCVGKYGPCDYLEGCNRGWNTKVLEGFGPREEHLNVRKDSTGG